MTLIESVRSFVSTCPYLSEFNKGINVDFLDSKISSYSIEEVPSTPILKKYVDGSSIRQYIFIFSSRESYGADVLQNLDNIGFYEKFATWLEEKSNNKDLPYIDNGRSINIEAVTNGYAFDTDIDKAKYQIQVKLKYFKGVL